MPRWLRIVKLTPIAIGVCEACGNEFHSSCPLEDDALKEIQQLFDTHESYGLRPHPSEPDLLTLQSAINYGIRQTYELSLPPHDVLSSLLRQGSLEL